MARTRTAPKHERPTLRDQLQAQHEILMAMATKSARQGAQSISLAQYTSGAGYGDFYLKVDLVQQDGEDDVEFIARMETFTVACIGVRDAINAGQLAKRVADAGKGGA